MGKPLLISIVLCFISCFAFGQKWYPVGGGIGGKYGINALCVYRGELYAGGWFSYADNKIVNNIAKWNGVSWSSVGLGVSGSVNSLCVYKGELYAGGQFKSAGGKPASNIAAWNGTSWANIGQGIQGNYYVNSMSVFNGKLYVGGYFDSAGNKPANNIAVWDSLNWSNVGVGLNGGVFALCPFDSVLYAGGGFNSTGSVSISNIAQWNGSLWSSVGTGVDSVPPYYNFTMVSAITLMNNKIYVGGTFSSAGGKNVNSIASWDGSNWSALDSGVSDQVYSLCAYNGILYVGGFYNKVGNIYTNDIASWDGIKWDSLSGGIGIPDTGVFALCIYNGDLYAGGQFGYVDHQWISEITRWQIPVGINGLKEKSAHSVFPNPSAGKFTFKSATVSEKATVEVYNIFGEEVYNEPLQQAQNDNTVDIYNQPAGIYLYRVIDENGSHISSGKLIIQ